MTCLAQARQGRQVVAPTVRSVLLVVSNAIEVRRTATMTLHHAPRAGPSDLESSLSLCEPRTLRFGLLPAGPPALNPRQPLHATHAAPRIKQPAARPFRGCCL